MRGTISRIDRAFRITLTALIVALFSLSLASLETFAEPDQELCKAVAKNDIEGVRKALDKGADVNVICRKKGDSPALITAVWDGSTEIVKILIENGVDINIKWAIGSKDFSALDIAKMRGNRDIYNMLKEAGARRGNAF